MDPFRSLVQRVVAPASERRTSLAPRPHFPDPPSIPSHRLKTGPARQDAAASRHRDAPSNARTSSKLTNSESKWDTMSNSAKC